MLLKVTLFIALTLSIIVPMVAYFVGEKSRGRFKKSLAINVVGFFGLLVLSTVVMFAQTASAAETTTASLSLGSGYAVASSASAALGALSEDSSIFGKALIFVALAEGIALYGLIIAFMILGAL